MQHQGQTGNGNTFSVIPADVPGSKQLMKAVCELTNLSIYRSYILTIFFLNAYW